MTEYIETTTARIRFSASARRCCRLGLSTRLKLAVLIAFALMPSAFAQMPFYGNYFLHDPGTMIKDNGIYFIYGDGQGISGIQSSDLRNWSGTNPVFPNGPPAWTTNNISGFTGYFWAPDIAYFNGRYNLYYACSVWGTINSAIGLVTSPSLTSPTWTDQGKVIESNYPTTTNTDLTAYNCIDPSILVDNDGSVWMSFGSYSDGILIMQLDPSTGKRIATNSPIYRVSNNGLTFFSNTEEGSCLYRHGNYYYLFVNFGGCCAGVDSTYNIRVGRSMSVTGPYFDKNGINMTNGGGTMVLESTGRFIGPGHAAIMNDNGTNWFTYHYYDGNNYGAATVGMNRLNWTDDGWPSLTNDWSAFYPFDVDARDHSGLYNGVMQNTATITNESARGNMLLLNGNTNYVLLANPVANASTFTAWVKWYGGADWQRIFDFGSNTLKYLFLTPRANTGNMRFAITTGGGGNEQHIDAPAALPTNSWCHVAVTLDGSQGILYLNAVPVATNAISIRPWQLLTKSNYVGKSQYTGDPYFNGEIDSFRVFSRALSPQEIRDDAYAHPELAHRYSFNTNTNVAWDSIGMAHGTLIGNAFITNGVLKLPGTSGSYVNLPGGLVSGSSAVTIEFWATFGTNGNWARVFDFGNISGSSGTQYLFFSPHTSLGSQRMEMKTNTTVTLDIPGTLDNQTVFVACIIDPTNNYAAIFTNAILEQSMIASWPRLTSVSTAWSFLGRSLFSSDAWLNGSIDEFRIYDGRLTPQQIAVDYQFGPDSLALPVSVTVSNNPVSMTLAWPSWAVGFAPQWSTDLTSGSWTSAAQTPTLSADQWLLNLQKTNTTYFFRLQR